MSLNEKVWYAVDVNLPALAREAVEYALMEAGALGTESVDADAEEMRVSGYFEESQGIEHVRETLFDALRLYGLPTSSVRNIVQREVADRDWLGEWKKSWQPVAVGERFIVAPPWADIPGAPDRLVIRIEPGMAFGTGTHETTRLCLAAIEKYFDGKSLLDVGTGTGILSIAAAMFDTRARIEACDTDPDAIRIARENAELNNVAARINFRVGTIEETTASASLVCANLTADIIIPLLPALVRATCERLVLSGILQTQKELVLAQLLKLGVTQIVEIANDGEWAAIII
ncbi:MAG: ribosomal protein methyltransferase [Blastocatellia bacterium]|jgi:ribosomal protein L11 methyltransferase|nr:ribosomal protein methyltransferase [Blastocatellia bacterium]